jgi:hypothetical protein
MNLEKEKKRRKVVFVQSRLYFPGFPVPACPGILTFLHFPYPGGNGRESREIKYGSFYVSNFIGFFLSIMYEFFRMMAKMMQTFVILIFQMNLRVL